MKSALPLPYIGFVGPAGAGKDTGAAYLVTHYRFKHVAMGDVVAKYISEHNLGTIDRPMLQKVATELRQKEGADFWMRKILMTHRPPLAISGIRTSDEASTLIAKGGIIIALHALPQTRYERITKRKSAKDSISFEEFMGHEEYELNGKEPSEINIAKVALLAHHTISTEGKIEAFFAKLDQIIRPYLGMEMQEYELL